MEVCGAGVRAAMPKAPTSKLQHPEKLQISNPKPALEAAAEIGKLGLLWRLDVDGWGFSGCWSLNVGALFPLLAHATRDSKASTHWTLAVSCLPLNVNSATP